MSKKYGVAIQLTEELLSLVFSKELLKGPNEKVIEAVKCIALANLGVSVSDWELVECEASKNCINDMYTFRLRSFAEIEGLKEIKEGLEYPKRYLKNFDD
jgi:hypothetical protein